MSCPRPIDLRCEIDSLDEPIRGRIGDRRGRSVEFRGWIELAAALTDLAQDASSSSSTSPSEEISHERS
ncbi:hypothetical protein [Conexibacter woesei]|uniref:hypothetical protein n=1 Tax=Conexibacter woesei TaxID=191495 RepID=UPI0002EA7862|nr:hypothetical protein [Conexibacter woesei]